MIFKNKLKPTKELKRLISQRATNDFMSHFRKTQEEIDAFKDLPKLNSGLVYDYKTTLYLRGKSVAPHIDEDFIEAKVVRSMFWVTKKKTQHPIYLQVGHEYAHIGQYDFAVFDDSILHSVSSDGEWEGIAIQCGAD
jgi:hypothetical protein